MEKKYELTDEEKAMTPEQRQELEAKLRAEGNAFLAEAAALRAEVAIRKAARGPLHK